MDIISLESSTIEPELFSLSNSTPPLIESEARRIFSKEETYAFNIEKLKLETYCIKDGEPQSLITTSLFNEYTQIQSDRGRFQNIISSNNAQKHSKRAENSVSKEERFKIEVEKALSEIMLLSELTSTLRNQTRYTLINSFHREARGIGHLLPISQRLRILGDIFLKSKNALDKGLNELRNETLMRRKFVSTLLKNITKTEHAKSNQQKWKLLFVEKKSLSLVHGRRYELFRDYIAINSSVISSKLFSKISQSFNNLHNSTLAKYDFASHFLVPLIPSQNSSKNAEDTEMDIDIEHNGINLLDIHRKSRTIKVTLLVKDNVGDSSNFVFYELASETIWNVLFSKALLLLEEDSINQFSMKQKHESLMLILFQLLSKECQELAQNVFLKSEISSFSPVEDKNMYHYYSELFSNQTVLKTVVLNQFLQDNIMIQLSHSFHLQITFCDNSESFQLYETQKNGGGTAFPSVIKIIILHWLKILYSLLNPQEASLSTGTVNQLPRTKLVRDFEDYESLRIQQKISSQIPNEFVLGMFDLLKSWTNRKKAENQLKLVQNYFTRVPRSSPFLKIIDKTSHIDICSNDAYLSLDDFAQQFFFEFEVSFGATRICLSYHSDCLVRCEDISIAAPVFQSEGLQAVRLLDREQQLFHYVLISGFRSLIT
jgi:hypothetical protein